MPLAATFQPAASSAARALAGSTRPGSDGFHAAVVSPCFPGFFTDSTSSQNSLCFAPLSSITTPCFPADTTLPERPPQATVSLEFGRRRPRVRRLRDRLRPDFQGYLRPPDGRDVLPVVLRDGTDVDVQVLAAAALHLEAH